MSRQDDIKNLINNHSRRLQKLKEQQALAGIVVDPIILIEIEKIQEEIQYLQTELGKIESVEASTKPRKGLNLPARGEFVGRTAEKERVLEGLKSNYPFVIIQGPAGIGKTALAREVGWMIKEKSVIRDDDVPSFEIIVWIEDHEGELTVNELLDTIGDALGYCQVAQSSLTNKRLEIIRQLQEISCLIIIDNFETVSDPEVEIFIRKIPSPICKVIITSRKKVLQDAGWIVPLRKMEFKDRLALARNEVKRLGTVLSDHQDTETTLRELCRLTDGDPYSIRIKIGQMQAGTPLQTVLRAATDDDKRLQPSWDALQHTPDAIKVLMTISLFQSPPALKDVEFVSEITGDEFAEAIRHLDELFLIDIRNRTDGCRYNLHSRTKVFVTKKLAVDQSLSHILYRHMADWIETYVLEHGGPKNWNGYPYLDQQYATIMTTIKWCCRQISAIEKKRTLTIWRAIDHYMSVKGNMKDYIQLGDLVLECAKSLEDLKTQTDIKVEVLGFAYMTASSRRLVSSRRRTEMLEKAEILVLEGLREYQGLRDWAGVGTANRYLGMIAKQRGDYKAAQQHFEDSLANFESIPGWDNLGIVLSELGDLALQQKDIEAAAKYQSRRLVFAEALRNPEGIAVALYNLGNIARINGRDTEALEFYGRALDTASRASRNDVMGASQFQLARILKQRWDIVEARQMAKGAQECFETVGKVSAEVIDLVTELENLKKMYANPWQRLFLYIRKCTLKRLNRWTER